VSSVTTELDFFSHLEPLDIESKEKDREKEDQLEDALLVLTLKSFPLLSLKREIRKFLDLPMIPNQEDLDPREPQASENFTVLKNLREKKLSLAQLL